VAAKPLPGVQAITLAEVRAEARLAAGLLKQHRAGCYDCSKARKDPYRYCDAGWELAKRDSRAQSALRKRKENEENGQGTLF
jgi:hypothetical protein